MKKLLFAILGLALISGVMISRAQTSAAPQEVAEVTDSDSLVNVIGYFCKNDTVEYWISKSNWRFADGDTIRLSGASTKVRLVVTDSTSTGYKMAYTLLDCVLDTTMVDSATVVLETKLLERLSKKFIGTKIEFETDEYGHITKYSNLGKLKKQTKALYMECLDELMKLPEFAELKSMAKDIKKLMNQSVDADQLLDGYTKELEMLFACYGHSYPLGEGETHEDASDTQLETNFYFTASIDEDGYYDLTFDEVRIIPKALVNGLLDEMAAADGYNDANGRVADEDRKISTDGTNENYLQYGFMSNGWPYEVLDQTTSLIGNQGKCKQTHISIDFFSFANWQHHAAE